MKVALVHDDLAQYGGAERLIAGMQSLWPEAPLYATLATSKDQFSNVHTSWMQYLPAKNSLFRAYFPLYPFAIEQFDLTGFDVVIASSSRFAHGVLVKPQSVFIWYCHMPSRIAWDTQRYFGGQAPFYLGPWLAYYRVWDAVAAARPDLVIANSENSRRRVWEVYRREAQVVYPFVDTHAFGPKGSGGKFFLVVSRLLSYKRIELAIESCNYLQERLVVVGTGPYEKYLRTLAGPTVQFTGRLTQQQLLAYYQACSALIVPGEEDFGMVALEALACGKPVIAYNRGGLAEVLTDEVAIRTSSQTREAFVSALTDLRSRTFSPEKLRRRAVQFSLPTFKRKLADIVERAWRAKHGHAA